MRAGQPPGTYEAAKALEACLFAPRLPSFLSMFGKTVWGIVLSVTVF